MRSITRIEGKGKNKGARRNWDGPMGEAELDERGTPVGMIQTLITLGREAVNELLRREVTRLTGPRYGPPPPGPVRLDTNIA